MTSLQDRLDAVRDKLAQASRDNRKDVFAEHRRNQTTAAQITRASRKRQQAESLLERQRAEDAGEDYERKQFWGYSVEEVERYEERVAEKRQNVVDAGRGFTDFEQLAHRSYLKRIKDFKPDAKEVTAAKDMAAESGVVSQDTVLLNPHRARPCEAAKARMADEMTQFKVRRITSQNKRVADEAKEGEDVTWINEKNAIFNRKIGKAYDAYTKEIKDNLERGTAL